MECTACHEPKHALFCSRCLKQGLKNHTDANHILTTQLQASRTRCARILSTSPGLDAHRSLAGTIYQLETQNRALDGDTQRLAAARKTRLVSLRARKEGILRRREALRSVRLPDPPVVREEIETIQRATSRLGEEVTHARRILVREALDVFGIRQVEEEWQVAGLRMPAPARFTGTICFPSSSKRMNSSRCTGKEYPSTHLNASFDHLVHLLGLIASYLDLQLPFPAQWQGLSYPSVTLDNEEPPPQTPTQRTHSRAASAPRTPLPHIGKLLLSAVPSLPFIRLADDRTDLPPIMQRRAMLYVSSSRDKWKRRQRRDPTANAAPGGEGRDKHRDKEDHLVLGYTMLLLDLMYLGTTQGVVVAEEGLPHPLRLLDSLRYAEDLGVVSHAPPGHVNSIVLPVNPGTVYEQVVKAFAEDPPGRVRERRRGKDGRGKEGDELGGDDWDLV